MKKRFGMGIFILFILTSAPNAFSASDSASDDEVVGITENGLEVFTTSPAGIDQPHKLAAVEG